MEQQTTVQSPLPRTRNYAVDLCRILSMWMIVYLHIFLYGDLACASIHSPYYYAARLIADFCLVSINLYVLFSSYFLVTQKFRPSKLLRLWLEVVFWCLAGYLFGILSGGAEFSFKTLLLEVLCPFSSKQYWFLSAYVILYLVSPILNVAIRNLTQRQHLAVCIGLLLCFSVWVDLYPGASDANYFNFNRGYNPVWFVILYFVGSYLRLHADPKKWKLPLLWYGLLTLIIFALQIWLSEALSILNLQNIWSGHFDDYNSLFVTLTTVFLFVAFLKKSDKIKGRFWQGLIVLLSSLTLGVYLIHENPYFREYLWLSLVKSQSFSGDSFLIIPLVLLATTAVFFACIALDGVRALLFSLFEKRKFWRRFLEKFDAFVLGILRKFAGFLGKKI